MNTKQTNEPMLIKWPDNKGCVWLVNKTSHGYSPIRSFPTTDLNNHEAIQALADAKSERPVMNQATGPTVRPWHVGESSYASIYDETGFCLAHCLHGIDHDKPSGPNSKLICQAVNSYEALLAVVEAARAFHDAYEALYPTMSGPLGAESSIVNQALIALSQLETTKH